MADALILTNQVRAYGWGSRTVLPALLGAPVPSAQPWAEIWIGAHPLDPSRLADGRSLAEVEPDLPFLVKLLAADIPLSIQAHPDRARAEAGYAADESLGIPAGSAERSYQDRNHKPELLIALTPTEALCGFRSPQEILAIADRWRSPRWSALVAGLDGAGSATQQLRTTFANLVQLAEEDRRALLAEVVTRASLLAAEPGSPDLRVAHWVSELGRLHPGDPGAATPLLLRLVALEPGDGLFVSAGVLHSYLHGAGVEIQATSDNVLRAGLTSKKVDLPELLSVIVGDFGPAPRVSPRWISAGLDAYDVPVDDFAVWRVHPTGRPVDVAAAGPVVVVCVEGGVELGAVALPPGRAAYLPADPAGVSIGGSGTCFVTAAGDPAPGWVGSATAGD